MRSVDVRADAEGRVLAGVGNLMVAGPKNLALMTPDEVSHPDRYPERYCWARTPSLLAASPAETLLAAQDGGRGLCAPDAAQAARLPRAPGARRGCRAQSLCRAGADRAAQQPDRLPAGVCAAPSRQRACQVSMLRACLPSLL